MARNITRKQKQEEARVSAIYNRLCSGVQIPIMETSKVMAVGLTALRAGDDDQTIGEKVVAYVQTIRTN